MSEPKIAIIMGSQSDWKVMEHAAETLQALGIAYEVKVISAHRTPERLVAFTATAEERGLECIIAGAGLAAHLAGVTAAHTLVPVLGVPTGGGPLGGMDALLATVQMPGGIPVGTLAIGKPGAINAALLAAAFMARHDSKLRDRLAAYREEQARKIPETPFES